MPREYNISWTKAQRKRLNSAVRRYNNAIRRAVKSNPQAAEFLPKEVKYKDLMAGITTRRALKNTVNKLTRATRPDALELVRQSDGSIVTRYERREFSILRSLRERQKAQRAKKLGIEKPKEGRAGTLDQARVTPDKRKASSFSAKSLRRFIETQERIINRSSAESARRYFSNYTSALRSVFGGFEEYDDAIEEIEEKILKLAGQDFNALQEAIDDAPDIEFIYEPQKRADKMVRILEYWRGVDV